VRRVRRRVYIARTEGKSAHMSTGGGGQSCGRAGAARRSAPVAAAAMVALAGAVEGQENRRGTRGEVVQRTRGVREATSVSGTSGKLIQACQGQRVGFSVSSMSKSSAPMNSRTAKAP
jgi:hypothetical protein